MKRLEVRLKRIEKSLDPQEDEWRAAMAEINRLMTDVYGPIPMPLEGEQPQVSAEDEAAVLAMLRA
ncbi:hypothetical protein FCL40_07240 [Ferrimonas sediminicola]|uniref:Uncharacterized protein n=1 Tax=Ferrimonas sediminicola TaxID=2569538 RepID=A0A4U1BFE2_9GAMM|nr:hypothetical protein [Ferrimonas sediminicola]TKB49938.1 hypothetical protein FCL40_07240 [Ferrimonas sediminicola]